MEALGIASAAIQLAQPVISGCLNLYRFLRAVQVIDESVTGLSDETENLGRLVDEVTKTLTAVPSTLNVPQGLLDYGEASLTGCGTTMRQLSENVERLQSNGHGNFVNDAARTMKLNAARSQISILRSQMLTYGLSFQYFIGALNLHINTSAAETLSSVHLNTEAAGSKIDDILAGVIYLGNALERGARLRADDEGSVVNLRLRSVAQSVVERSKGYLRDQTQARTPRRRGTDDGPTSRGLVRAPTGFEVEQLLSVEKKIEIANWSKSVYAVPKYFNHGRPIPPPSQPAFSIWDGQSGMTTPPRSDAYSRGPSPNRSQTSESEDSLLEYMLFEGDLEDSKQMAQEGNYKDAELRLRAALDHCRSIRSELLPDESHLKLELATLCVRNGKFEEANVLCEHLKSIFEHDPDPTKKSDTLHLLAQTNLKCGRLPEAKNDCKQAIRSRLTQFEDLKRSGDSTRLASAGRVFCESAALMISICEHDGDTKTARSYEKLLVGKAPEGFVRPEFKGPDQIIAEFVEEETASTTRSTSRPSVSTQGGNAQSTVSVSLQTLPATFRSTSSPPSEHDSVPIFGSSNPRISVRSSTTQSMPILDGLSVSESIFKSPDPFASFGERLQREQQAPISRTLSETLSEKEQIAALAKLTEAKFDLESELFSADKALLWAARYGAIDVAILTLKGWKQRTRRLGLLMSFKERKAKIEAQESDDKQNRKATPLICAAACGHKDLVQFLVENKASITAVQYEKKNALMKAVEEGHYEIVELLLQSGSSVQATCAKGWTPLHYAAYHGRPEMISLLCDRGANVEALTLASHLTQDSAWTPLQLAAYHNSNSDQHIYALIKYHASWTRQDGAQRNLLHLASWGGSIHAFDVFLNKGLNTYTKTNDGRTALHYAATNGHQEIVAKLLHQPETNVNAPDKGGWTPLFSAAFSGRVGMIALLLDNGAEVDHLDGSGNTALMACAPRGHYKSICMLLSAGARADLVNNSGLTALSSAASHGFKTVVVKLLEYGADLNRPGETATYWAQQHNHKDILAVFEEWRKKH